MLIKPRVGVVGAGKVGAVFAARFLGDHYPIAAVSVRSDSSRARVHLMLPEVAIVDPAAVVAASDIVVLAVPDDSLRSVVAEIEPHVRHGQLIFHVSGRHGRAMLAPLESQGAVTMAIHPAMTFSGTLADVDRECVFGVTAAAADVDMAQTLVSALGGTMVLLAEADRVAYHAALAHSSNHLTTVVNQAMDLLREIGATDPSSLLRPLVTAALDNTLALGDAALTGPVVRGDVETVRDHLAAIESPRAAGQHAVGPHTGDQQIGRTYRALATATTERAKNSGALSADKAEQLFAVLELAATKVPAGIDQAEAKR